MIKKWNRMKRRAGARHAAAVLCLALSAAALAACGAGGNAGNDAGVTGAEAGNATGGNSGTQGSADASNGAGEKSGSADASSGAEEKGAAVNGKKNAGASGELYVYNWGEYIDPEVVNMFEAETGIKVVYDMFETNEEMYPVIQAGGVVYDAVCPSDYMIQKMAENGLLAEINWDNVPNISEIGAEYMEKAKQFDPENKYAVPYTWGTVGILYNKNMLDEMGVAYPTKWADLWNPALKDEILMQDSVRDAFMVALKKDGHSLNSLDDAELDQAMEDLIAQKPLVQAYVVDQVRDKMIGGEAAVGVIYSGELLYVQDETEGTDVSVEYVIPEEGTNLWIDAWVIPKNAKNKENAEKWINFLCRPDIAKMNFEYITYATPNTGAYDLLDKELQENKALFPDDQTLENCEVFSYMGDDAEQKYNDRWKIVKAS